MHCLYSVPAIQDLQLTPAAESPTGPSAPPKVHPCPCGAARHTDGMGQLREPWSRFGFLFLSSPCGCAQVFKNSSKALSYLLLSAKKCFFTNNIHYCSVTAALVVFIFRALTSFGVFVLAEVTLTTCCWSWSLCKNTLLITGRDRGGKLGFVSVSGVCGEAMQTVQSKNDVHIDCYL